MSSNTSTEQKELPSEAQRQALISLLSDDDPKVHRAIHETFLGYGPSVSDWLHPHLLSRDPVLRRHAREIVTHFQRLHADQAFMAFCENQGEDLDLELGVGLLARTRYPDASLEAFTAQLDQAAAEVRVRSLRVIAPQQRLLVLNQYLFKESGFRGNADYENDVENCYFNRIMERRTGNPIGLCVIYLLLCRRLGLPVSGIGLPGHFVCRFQSATMEVFIDCFHEGRFLTKADCVQHIQKTHHGLDEGYLAPVSTRRILMRTCSNLQQTYLRQEDVTEATRIKHYLIALAG